MCNPLIHHSFKQLSILFSMLLFFCLPSTQAQNVMGNGSVEGQSTPASISLDDLLARYPTGSIHTIEDAGRAGDDVHKMHALIEEQFATEQKLCFPKFFANSCLIDAKERHRVALAKVRVIEIEMNKFKRRANVMARDKSLTAKRGKEATELVSHAKENQNSSAENVSETSRSTPSSSATKPQRSAEARIAKRQVEIKSRQAAEAENAKQRASHIAAYEKKQRESEARQREIATKKLEKAHAQGGKEVPASK